MTITRRDKVGFWILMSFLFGVVCTSLFASPTMAFRQISEVEEMRFNTFYNQLRYFDKNYIIYMRDLRKDIELLQWKTESLRVLCTE